MTRLTRSERLTFTLGPASFVGQLIYIWIHEGAWIWSTHGEKLIALVGKCFFIAFVSALVTVFCVFIFDLELKLADELEFLGPEWVSRIIVFGLSAILYLATFLVLAICAPKVILHDLPMRNLIDPVFYCVLTFLSMLVGLGLSVLKKNYKWLYGVAEVTVAVVSSLSTITGFTFAQFPQIKQTTQNEIVLLVVFTFLLSRGITNIREGLEDYAADPPETTSLSKLRRLMSD